MNREQYKGDSRYAKILEQMDLLNIMDISTTRQSKNGTIVWKLPIKNTWKKGTNIEVASFSTGYVRNQNSGYSNYQLNKRCQSEPQYYPEYEWCERKNKSIATGKYNMYTTKACVLIPNEIDRLEYLISYCLKNYYIKHANFVANGDYVTSGYWKAGIDCGHYDRIQDLESNLEHSAQAIRDLEDRVYKADNKLSNAISPTKYQCAINKLHDLENKLATINRISSI